MIFKIYYIIISLSLIMITSLEAQNTGMSEPTTVNFVNLQKYSGMWYEIAKIPNSFQKKCARNTTAAYQLRSDGNINVVNRCIEADGSVNEAKGIAKVVDSKSNAKLKVSFVRILGISLFWGDYWIIGLDKEYKFAVVGTPSRKYGWILSRTPKLSGEEMQTAFSILKQQGYNPKDFEMTEQDL